MRRFKNLLFNSKVALIIFIESIIGAISSVVFGLIFVKIADEVLEADTHFLDIIISQFIYTLRSPTLTKIMIIITDFGAGYALAALMIFVLFLIWRHHKKEAIIFIIISTMGILINFGLKNITQRPRPVLAPLITETSYSFPSGHAMNSFVFYASLSFYFYHFTRKKTLSLIFTLCSIILVLLIGFSRVYLGVHYPSDIIGGYFIGLWWLATAFFIEKTFVFFKLFKESK